MVKKAFLLHQKTLLYWKVAQTLILLQEKQFISFPDSKQMKDVICTLKTLRMALFAIGHLEYQQL